MTSNSISLIEMLDFFFLHALAIYYTSHIIIDSTFNSGLNLPAKIELHNMLVTALQLRVCPVQTNKTSTGNLNVTDVKNIYTRWIEKSDGNPKFCFEEVENHLIHSSNAMLSTKRCRLKRL